VSAIPHGADWERITTGAIDESTFFIPIVTPFYMQSEWCARETRLFETRERTIFETYPDLLRNRRRIFPLLWIDVSDIEPVDEPAFAAIKAAQWCDFSHLRHRNLEQDEEVLAKVAAFAKSIIDVLQLRVEAPLSEAEREQIAREAEEIRLQAEEERRSREKEEAREAERRRMLDESATRAETERLAAEKERRRRQREEAERHAAEQRARDKAARQALLERFFAALRSRTAWLIAGAALLALLAALLLPRLFGDREERATFASPPVEPASQRISDNEAAAIAPQVVAAPSVEWLFRRWCVGGNRSNVQSIEGDRNRITISFAGGSQSENVVGVEEGAVTTEVARYLRQDRSLVIEEMGRQQRLERCE
jgi:TIR domain